MRQHARDDFIETLRQLHKTPRLLPENIRRPAPYDLSACLSGTDKNFKGRVLWISDLHLFHKNIIGFVGRERRPFDSMEDMNDVLVANILNTVQPDDILIFVGDITFEKVEPDGTFPLTNEILRDIWSRCAWTVNILGNHDVNKQMQIMNLHFDEVLPSLTLDYRGRSIFVSHYPVGLDVLDTQLGSLNVHGHTHCQSHEAPIVMEALYPDGFSGTFRHLSACVEVTELGPMTFEEMLARPGPQVIV